MKVERVKAFVNGQIKEFTKAGFEMAKEYYGAIPVSELSLSRPIELSKPLLIPKPIELSKPILAPAAKVAEISAEITQPIQKAAPKKRTRKPKTK